MSLRALAKRMGMSHSQLSLAFSGDRKLQLDEVAQIASIFNEPIPRIMANAGVAIDPTGNSRVSVIGAMQGDGTVTMHPEGVIERTDAPEGVPEDGSAVQARCTGSTLDWMDSWVFFCNHTTGVDPAVLGRFALCKIHDGPFVMASVRRGYREGTYNLRGPFTADSVTLDSAAIVLATRN